MSDYNNRQNGQDGGGQYNAGYGRRPAGDYGSGMYAPTPRADIAPPKQDSQVYHGGAAQQQSHLYDQGAQRPVVSQQTQTQGAQQPPQQDYYGYGQRPPQQKRKNNGLKVFAMVIAAVFTLSLFTLAGVGVYSVMSGPGISDGTPPYTQTDDPTYSQPDDPDDATIPTPETTSPVTQNPGGTPKVEITDTPTTPATNTSLSAGELTTTEIYNKVLPSVVGVTSEVEAYQGRTSTQTGSGIIMTSNGYIITNAHVIEGGSNIKVILYDNTELDAVLVGESTSNDLAVLKVEATNLVAAEFGDSDQLVVGEKAVAIGNPYGMEMAGSTTQGIISGLGRKVQVDTRIMTLIQTDAAINPGNSGGPLVNRFGQVIGINSIKIASSQYEGMGFAIPMADAKPIIDALIENGSIPTPMIGISGQNVESGVLVSSITPGTSAASSGLMPNDIIIAVDGVAISNMAELNSEKERNKIGDTITLTVLRGAQQLDFDIMLYAGD